MLNIFGSIFLPDNIFSSVYFFRGGLEKQGKKNIFANVEAHFQHLLSERNKLFLTKEHFLSPFYPHIKMDLNNKIIKLFHLARNDLMINEQSKSVWVAKTKKKKNNN